MKLSKNILLALFLTSQMYASSAVVPKLKIESKGLTLGVFIPRTLSSKNINYKAWSIYACYKIKNMSLLPLTIFSIASPQIDTDQNRTLDDFHFGLNTKVNTQMYNVIMQENDQLFFFVELDYINQKPSYPSLFISKSYITVCYKHYDNNVNYTLAVTKGEILSRYYFLPPFCVRSRSSHLTDCFYDKQTNLLHLTVANKSSKMVKIDWYLLGNSIANNLIPHYKLIEKDTGDMIGFLGTSQKNINDFASDDAVFLLPSERYTYVGEVGYTTMLDEEYEVYTSVDLEKRLARETLIRSKYANPIIIKKKTDK